MKSLDFTLAARYDHYSDFGSTTNPKASFRFQPSKAFLLRGSFSTGFRAPTLYDINAAQSFGTPGTVNDPGNSHLGPQFNADGTPKLDADGNPVIGCVPNAGYAKNAVCKIQPEVLNGGNTNLKPEKSRNATLGIVLEPFRDFTFGVDAFRVNMTLVAAILTVMGYSMVDTIVVFDRIREIRGKYGILSRQLINDAINQTLSRTLLTAGTTLMTLLVMYIWGGPAIHGFTFILLIGIIIGTYSSIAVAAPFLLVGVRQPVAGQKPPTKQTGATGTASPSGAVKVGD